MAFTDVLNSLEDAIDAVKEAQAALVPANKIKTSEAYILGSLKATLASLSMCKEIVKSAIDNQIKTRSELRPELPSGVQD